MNEKIVASLEVAKILQAAGFRQDSALSWNKHKSGWLVCSLKVMDGAVAAPTFSEIWGELLGAISVGGVSYYLQLEMGSSASTLSYRELDPLGRCLHGDSDCNIANAAALMWLWIKEQGLVK